MRSRCLLLVLVIAAGGCVIPPSKVGARVPLSPATATAPATVVFLVRPPANARLEIAGLVFASDNALSSVMSELRDQAAALGADAVTELSLGVATTGYVSASGTAIRWR